MLAGVNTSSRAAKTGLAAFITLILVIVLIQQEQIPYNSSTWKEFHYSSKDNLMNVQNRTLGFSKIFVISMPERRDKRDTWSLATIFSDIDIEYVEGVRGSDMPQKTWPSGWDPSTDDGALGCFRSHFDVIQRMLHERIESALILEDDADWDVMIKAQLVEVAKGLRWFQNSTQPSHSPYGDEWDMLWLGHCGVMDTKPRNPNYYVIENDPTVPPLSRRSYRARKPDLSPPELAGEFSRVVLNNGHGLCSAGYGLTLKGAQKMMYQFSVEPKAPVFDRALAALCVNKYDDARCYSVFPAMIESYRAPGNKSADSDRLDKSGAGFRQVGETANTVFPIKVNLEHYVKDDGLVSSQWPDVTMLKDINPWNFDYPVGHPVILQQ